MSISSPHYRSPERGYSPKKNWKKSNEEVSPGTYYSPSRSPRSKRNIKYQNGEKKKCRNHTPQNSYDFLREKENLGRQLKAFEEEKKRISKGKNPVHVYSKNQRKRERKT